MHASFLEHRTNQHFFQLYPKTTQLNISVNMTSDVASSDRRITHSLIIKINGCP